MNEAALKVLNEARVATSGEVVSLRAGGSATVDRKALLAALRAGELVELEVDIQAFAQDAKPNRNFVRVRDGALEALARSFAGAPFQRNHSFDVQDTGGTILDSKLERKGGGLAVILQTVKLTHPEFVERALRGTMQKFSISFGRGSGEIHCSICEAPLWAEGCFHYPGQKLADGRIVERVFTAPEGLETSDVAIPAVKQTHVEDIRTALAALRAGEAQQKPPPKEIRMNYFAKLAAIIGLSAAAVPTTEDAALSAVEALKRDRDKLAADLELARTSAEETKTALATAQAELAPLRAKILKGEVDGFIAELVTAGKLIAKLDKDGKPVVSKLEAQLRTTAEKFGVDAARESAESLPVIGVALGVSQAAGTQPTAEQETAKVRTVQLTAEQRELNRKAGITDEDWLKYGPGSEFDNKQKAQQAR